MKQIETRIDSKSDTFKENEIFHKGLADDLKSALHTIEKMGPEKRVEKHRSRGKMTARDRIDFLKDDGTDFLEFSAFAAHQVYKDDIPAAGIITGIITVQGRLCVVVANDATVKGGTYYPLTVKKHLRAQ